MWYNGSTKIVAPAVLIAPRSRTHSLEECIMDTVPHSAPQDNSHLEEIVFDRDAPPWENWEIRKTGLRYHRGSTMVIYALIDPRDGKARYIGKTNNLLARFNEHMRLNGPNDRKHAWLKELLDLYMLPYMHTLEVVKVYSEAREREVAWIEAYIKAGIDLLNIEDTPPGEGA